MGLRIKISKATCVAVKRYNVVGFHEICHVDPGYVYKSKQNLWKYYFCYISDIECRIMSSVSPTPHSAVGRSEQWLDLCSRPSDEDVKWRSRRQESHPLPGSLNTIREE